MSYSRSNGRRYVELIRRAADGNRRAAAQLIIGGWFPDDWYHEDDAVLDNVIRASKMIREAVK